MREALIEVRGEITDPMVKIEAQSLAEEVGSYRFAICTVVWYDALSHMQQVIKLLKSSSMQVDVAVNLLRKTETALSTYRTTGFVDAQFSAMDMCNDMNVEAVLQQKRLRSTKKRFSNESPDEPINDALKKMEVTFFNVVVDAAISSLQKSMQALREVRDRFGVLTSFQNLSNGELTKQSVTLSNTLSYGGQSDVDGKELAQELKNLPELPTTNMTALELLTFIHEK